MSLHISQPSLFDSPESISSYIHSAFSHKNFCSDAHRIQLENRYHHLFQSDDRFNRKIVSFQANKDELIHSWIKYREGFSSILVETLIDDFGLQPGDSVLDPFAGSATTLLVAKTHAVDAIGIDILPNCHLAWAAKKKFADYDLQELKIIFSKIIASVPGHANRRFPHITITESAFPEQAENDLMWYTEWFDSMGISDDARNLCKLILTSILEDVSYTRKDGQYLRWDYRSEKLRSRNDIRAGSGKKVINGIDKGKLPSIKEALVGSFSEVVADIEILQAKYSRNGSNQALIQGSTLEVLPTFPENSFNAVITSPPYANRYDYTRTYALELAYLGYSEKILSLRQELLSCTVESKSKIARLEDFYRKINQSGRYKDILEVIRSNEGLNEVNTALLNRWKNGDINNRGVLPMINQYFSELTFVFAELFRTCRSGSNIAFVNDNVRYGGEIIPVDTITTSLAESIGFTPIKIIVLAQRKGNSSQQMERYGREELRKCITIWKKP